jgi:hypothetical protein
VLDYTLDAKVGNTTTHIVSSQIDNTDGTRTFVINPNYQTTYGNTSVPLVENLGDSVKLKQVEKETWAPLSLCKSDWDEWDLKYSNSELKTAEGNGSYEGVQYQLFCTSNPSNFFSFAGNTKTDGSKTLSFGAGVTSVTTTDGLGVTGTTSFGTTLYPVLYNGSNLIVKGDENGYAKTPCKLPYSGNYVWVEVKAPTGYKIKTKLLNVTNEWTSGNDGATIIGYTMYFDCIVLKRSGGDVSCILA